MVLPVQLSRLFVLRYNFPNMRQLQLPVSPRACHFTPSVAIACDQGHFA